MTEAPRNSCLHCGADIAGSPHAQIVLLDGAFPVCGEACRRAAEMIVAGGLAEFYRFREAPAQAPEQDAADPGRWAVYDRPAFQADFTRADGEGWRVTSLLVEGVRCAACAWLIERRLSELAGVDDIRVDPVTARLSLRWDPSVASLSSLVARVAELGYRPHPFTARTREDRSRRERRMDLLRLIVAGLGMMQVMSYAIAMYAGAFEAMDPQILEFLRLVSLIVATPVVLFSGAPFFRGAWRGMTRRQLGMDVPVALAIGGAYAASVWNTFSGHGEVYFDSATMFVFFLSCARYLESAARRRALDSVGALGAHLPTVATRERGGRLQEVGVAELVLGDRVIITSGGVCPVDGELLSPDARFDESMLTGESRSVPKSRGDSVAAGAINRGDPVRIQVSRVGADTVMAQIDRLIGSAREERPAAARIADTVASYFISAVLVLAVGTGIVWWLLAPERAFEIVLAVLVVTCPCALALATPAAFTVATHALARRGVLLKRPGALQVFARTDLVVFDKTGTLTEPQLDIAATRTLGRLGRNEVLGIAARLEAQSEHPLARAFRDLIDPGAPVDIRVRTGQGIEGDIDGTRFRMGRLEFVAALSGDRSVSVDCETPGSTLVYLGDTTSLLARFEIAERLREGTSTVSAALSRHGADAMILSGDREGPVAAIARRLGFGGWEAGLTPDEKLVELRARQRDGRTVVMVGDGINDAPVLAGADASIAIGAGTALARQSADAVLLGDSLVPLATTLDVARRTQRVLRQNIAWAIGYNLLALPLAAGGLIAPWMAALGMSASSLLVTANALRLNRVPRTRESDQRAGLALRAAPEPVK